MGSPNRQAGPGKGEKMRKIVSGFYNLARLTNDFSAVLSGKPARIARRGINKGIGRTVGPKLYLKGRRGKRWQDTR